MGSEHVQELGASVLLVGLMIVALVVSGRWNPVASPPEPAPSMQSMRPVMATDPTTTSGLTPMPTTVPGGDVRSGGAASGDSGPSGSVRAPATGSSAPPAPDMPVPERWTDGARPGYGFEVAASSAPDSAIAVLRLIMRATKLPCRIVTKTTGDTYRVVVGPFPSRREAQKAINELFKTPLVKRARLVQIPE